jgi:hypothetical protein
MAVPMTKLLSGRFDKTKTSVVLTTLLSASLSGLIQPKIGCQDFPPHLGHMDSFSKISSQSRHNLAIFSSMALVPPFPLIISQELWPSYLGY